MPTKSEWAILHEAFSENKYPDACLACQRCCKEKHIAPVIFPGEEEYLGHAWSCPCMMRNWTKEQQAHWSGRYALSCKLFPVRIYTDRNEIVVARLKESVIYPYAKDCLVTTEQVFACMRYIDHAVFRLCAQYDIAAPDNQDALEELFSIGESDVHL